MTRWGAPHLFAIGATLLCGVSWGLFLRRSASSDRQQTSLRLLAGALLLSGVAMVVVDRVEGVSWQFAAPLHLCDLSVYLAVAAALTRREGLIATAYFWSLGGALPAMLWPDLAADYPEHRFWLYFMQHGLLVVVAFVFALAFPFRRPLRWAAKAWLCLNLCACCVATVNAVFGYNYMYLSRPPGAGSPLDVFGPWPWYIVGGEVVGFWVVLGIPHGGFRFCGAAGRHF